MLSKSCIVVFSGGQDSTTCLFWAKQNFEHVEALSFDYGQRHKIELESAKAICEKFNVPQTVLHIDTFAEIGGNSLLDPDMPIEQKGKIPNSFVPGRNLVFMTYAAAFAWRKGITHLVTGVCQTDYSGYPDCRENTMNALAQSLSLGMEKTFHIHTPLMFLNKAESVYLAKEVGAFSALAYSHTCYEGQIPPCGTCPACELRAKGFLEAGAKDPLTERFL